MPAKIRAVGDAATKVIFSLIAAGFLVELFRFINQEVKPNYSLRLDSHTVFSFSQLAEHKKKPQKTNRILLTHKRGE